MIPNLNGLVALQHKLRQNTVPASIGDLGMPAAASKRSLSAVKDLYGVGEIPPLGHVPEKMHAWAIRKERHGPPDTSFQLEVVPTWPIGEDEVLILVMAAGV